MSKKVFQPSASSLRPPMVYPEYARRAAFAYRKEGFSAAAEELYVPRPSSAPDRSRSPARKEILIRGAASAKSGKAARPPKGSVAEVIDGKPTLNQLVKAHENGRYTSSGLNYEKVTRLEGVALLVCPLPF